MFGYINVNEQELKLREYTAYRSFYCGLCRNLHQRYGRTAQMMLNYDLTFLALLLNGLYEPEGAQEAHRCALHPTKKHGMVVNDAVSYAADMTVVLSYQKLMDDWEDEHRHTRRAMASFLKSDYGRLREIYPRQVKTLEENIMLLRRAEKENRTEIDYAAGLNGRYLAEIFVWKEDGWQQELRNIGFYMGKFIYLMDALEDMEKDRKKGNFNVFSKYGPIWGTDKEEQIREILMEMMTEASRAFELLPILEHAEILRNILYSGVWTRYASLRQKALEQKSKSMEQQEEHRRRV